MSTAAWIILLVLLIPIIGILIWVIVLASVVRVPSGSLGLLMVKGQATDTTLPPGRHFLFALRRRMVEEYPSVELAYRAGVQAGSESDATGQQSRRTSQLEQSGPDLTVTLGDRTTATVSFTVRFVLMSQQLRIVHERFGPDGVFGIVRDEAQRAVRNMLCDPGFGVENLFGAAREASQTELAEAVGAALEADGIRLTAFTLGTVDLGRTGEVIGATVRAR
jgi:regulator of protease activity HflC (stomatin/prohibitin superfamily)